jgi:hypothetical protein
MRELYFVGKALPEDKRRHNTPFPSGSLTDLEALDPRHGVFPNLVATPLLSTVMAFYEDGDVQSALKVLDQAKEILKDKTARRINVLSKPTSTTLRLDPGIPSLLGNFAPERTLCLVFKHSAVYALCTYLLTGKEEFTEGDLNSNGAEFLRRCTQAPGCSFELPVNKNTQVGLFFRLCTDDDPDGCGVTSYLRHAVRQMAPESNVERILAILRSFVPLLHNDAYDKTPIGLVQARFLAGRDLPPLCPPDHEPAPAVYWRFIGRVIRSRLLAPPMPTWHGVRRELATEGENAPVRSPSG